jgi:hypothetical protein
VADDVSYISRFALKFIEITAAGVATAVSGYLIAHVGGLLTSAAVTPAAPPVAVSGPATPIVRRATASPSAEAAPAIIESHATPEIRPAAVTAEKPAAPQVSPAHRTTAAESPAKDAKPRDNDAKPRDAESIEATVRAALAKADAKAEAKIDAKTDAKSSVPHETLAHEPEPRQAPATETHESRASAAPQPAAAATLHAADAAPQSIAQPPPLATVDVKSLPIAGVPAGAAGDQGPPRETTTQASTDDDTANKHTPFADLFAPFKKLPGLLRDDPPIPAGEAPRPPAPVGQ